MSSSNSDREVSRLAWLMNDYRWGTGPCMCGQVRGHAGWIGCVTATTGVDSGDKSPRQRANAPGHGHRGKDPQ